jgi:ribosomal protein L11 methyltransferase
LLIRYNIAIPSEFEEPLIGLADRLGVSLFLSPLIRDSGKGETDYEFTGQSEASFILSAIEQDSGQVEAEIKSWLSDMGLNSGLTSQEYSDNQDWMAGFREHFQPIVVNNAVVIRPPWAEPLPQEETATTLLIDPGMAFGTGTHETTRLCLEWLQAIDCTGQVFLDLGAGSGILSFYLMKKGASAGVAIELEGAAVENMRKNAALNGMSDRLKLLCADLGSYEPEIKADGLVANITSPVILEYLPVFSPWVKSGGWGVFSGVNSTNAEEVKEAFTQNGWSDLQEKVEGDWHGFLLKKL